jgi:hypothetical protein
MVAVGRGRSTTRRAGTNAMQYAGSATYDARECVRSNADECLADAQALVRGMAPVLLMIYQATIVYVALLCASVSACAAVSDTPESNVGESAETVTAKKAVPGSASARGKGKRLMMLALLMAMHTCQRLTLLSISAFTVSELHEGLQEQARRNFESADLDLYDSGAEEWSVLFRAGGRWHSGPANMTWKSQALPATCERKCFLLHLGAFESALGGNGGHLVIPIAADSTDWRGAVLERIRALDYRLVPVVASLPCLLNGKELGPSCSPALLRDLTVRLRPLGLRGGAPKGKKQIATKDVDQMEKAELMAYAKDVLGVETRRMGSDGKKNLWRKVVEVNRDCKAAQAKLCQSQAENNPTPGSASSLPATGSASSSPPTMPAPNVDETGKPVVDKPMAAEQKAVQAKAIDQSLGDKLRKSASENRDGIRKAAVKLGVKRQGQTCAQLQSRVKDATRGQQPLIIKKSANPKCARDTAGQSDASHAPPAPGSASASS